MSIFAGKRRISEEEPELNMIPIMNIFLVIIPFLLTSISFFHIKAISTSVPVLAGSASDNKPQAIVKVTVILEMLENEFRLTASADDLPAKVLKKYNRRIKKRTADLYPLKELKEYLQEIKKAYPASATIILIPNDSIVYESIIQAMDAARKFNENQLFPNVVLASSLG